MKTKKEPYECIRCGYTVQRKDCITHHLYKLKKPCPAVKNNIELTDEIKQFILANRRYHIPKDPNQVVNKIINNYNQINTFISNMDVLEKIKRYAEYKQIEIMDFEDMVDEKYQGRVQRLEHDSYKFNFQLNISDLFHIIDSLTGLSNGIEYFNTFFDEKTNKMKIMTSGEWRSTLIDSGIKELIHTVQRCYLDSYECYLIRKIKHPDICVLNKVIFRERLDDYYKFLGCFELPPFITNKTDSQVLCIGDEYDTEKFAIQEEFQPIYTNIKERLSLLDINRIRKEVREIFRKNTRANVIELNRKVVELFQMDEQFKTEVLSKISYCANE